MALWILMEIRQGAFNRKQLDTDFEKHLGLVKLVQKVTSPTIRYFFSFDKSSNVIK